MNLSFAFFLGLLQGLSEFLPISSSGHLVIAESWLELNASQYLLFDLVLHVATLLAVCLYFRERLVRLLETLWQWPRNAPLDFAATENRQMITGIFLSTLFTGIVAKGAGLDRLHNAMRLHPDWVGVAFIVMGTLLLLTYFMQKGLAANGSMFPIHFMVFAVIVGIAQGIAVLPGISRSGTTVAVALLLGASQKTALEYSFMMSIPAILAATLLEMETGAETVEFLPTMVGFIAALVAGYVSLSLLAWMTRKGKLYQFGFYTIPLGIWVIWRFHS